MKPRSGFFSISATIAHITKLWVVFIAIESTFFPTRDSVRKALSATTSPPPERMYEQLKAPELYSFRQKQKVQFKFYRAQGQRFFYYQLRDVSSRCEIQAIFAWLAAAHCMSLVYVQSPIRVDWSLITRSNPQCSHHRRRCSTLPHCQKCCI